MYFVIYHIVATYSGLIVFYSIYLVLEEFLLKFNIFKLFLLRIFLTNLFFKQLSFLLSNLYFIKKNILIILQANKLFFIRNWFLKIDRSFSLLLFNSQLKLINLQYVLNSFYFIISNNKIFIAFIFVVTVFVLFSKIYYLIKHLLKLKNIFFFHLKKCKKNTIEKNVTLFINSKNIYIFLLTSVFVTVSHLIFCFKTLIPFLLQFYKIYKTSAFLPVY